MTKKLPVVAYLSPSLPALSETFVYEELLAVERRGIRVIPVAVRRSAVRVKAQQTLAQRVTHLYDFPPAIVLLMGVARLPMFGGRAIKAMRMLAADIAECGPLHLGSWKLAYQFFAATKLANLLRQENCTHLHVHFADTPGQIAMYASALSNVPFTITAHANDIFDGGVLLQRKAERAARLLTISEYNCRYLERLGVPKDRLGIVRCGVSFASHPMALATPPKKNFRIGSLGRLVEKKGFDVLLHALVKLKKTTPNIELCIAGDGPLLVDLQQQVRTLDLLDQVHFEGGLSHDQVAQWMRQLDVFVLACKQDKQGDMDGIPVVLMEAMSQSVAVISTRLSGIPELILHNQTGLLAQPNDAADLARQIEFFIQSPDLVARMIGNARAHVRQEFGQDINVDRLLGYFATDRAATHSSQDMPINNTHV